MSTEYELNIAISGVDAYIKKMVSVGKWYFNFDNYSIRNRMDGMRWRQKVFWFEANLDKVNFLCTYEPDGWAVTSRVWIIMPAMPLEQKLKANKVFIELMELPW